MFRIGIHLGDVVEESDGDLMGDGVNIAAAIGRHRRTGRNLYPEDAYPSSQNGRLGSRPAAIT